MARKQLKTLSEPMDYILLALTEECCSVDMMKRVEILSDSRVVIRAGTTYTLLKKFEENNVIRQTSVEGKKHFYVITDYGKTLLQQDHRRLSQVYFDGKRVMEDPDEN